MAEMIEKMSVLRSLQRVLKEVVTVPETMYLSENDGECEADRIT